MTANVETLRNSETGEFPAYAWPGGYAIAYVADDGELICATCVNTQEEVHFAGNADGWRIDGYQTADWHDVGDGEWACAHCYAVIDPEVEV